MSPFVCVGMLRDRHNTERAVVSVFCVTVRAVIYADPRDAVISVIKKNFRDVAERASVCFNSIIHT